MILLAQQLSGVNSKFTLICKEWFNMKVSFCVNLASMLHFIAT